MSAWWTGKSTKRYGCSYRSGLGARSPSFLPILCFDDCSGGLGAFLAFLAAWAVPVVACVADEVGDLTESLVEMVC